MGLFDDVLQREAPPRPSLWGKIKGGAKAFGKALIEAPQALGRDIFQFTPQYRELEEQEKAIKESEEKVRKIAAKLPVDSERKIRLENFLKEEVPTISKLLPKRNTRQIIGDVAETVLLAVPIPAVRALRGLPWLAKAARGAGIGGAFGAAEALRGEEITPKEAIKKTAIGAGFGLGAEIGLPLLGKGILKGGKVAGKGVVKAGQKIIPERVKEAGSAIKQSLMSVKSRLANYYGEEGRQIVNKFLAADEEKLLITGQVVDKLDDLGFYKLSQKESQNLVDLLEGRATKAISKGVRDNFGYIDKLRKGIAQEATEVGVRVRVKRGVERPFKARKNYYPHDVLAPEVLKKGDVREELLNNAVRIGKFKNKQEAVKTLDAWIEIVEKEGRGISRENYFIKHLIDTKQAKNKTQAIGMILRFWRRARLPRYGKLEYAREFDFPFYDPNPQRAITKWILGSVDRLETIKAFGPKAGELNRLLGTIRRKLGPEPGREAAHLVKVMTGAIEKAPNAQRPGLMIRSLQVPKLAFSQIVNLGQNVNTLLATDLPSFAKGIASFFTKAGRKQAVKTGAPLESIIRQTIELGAGGEQRFASLFLKYTGFQLTEKINRTVAANAGIAYAQRNFQSLIKKPTDKYLRQRLSELGINVEQALKKGKLSQPELLKAGQRVAAITQFRYRPMDFPAFYSSDFGRLAFQFKSFAYNQTIFLKNQIVREFSSGKPGRAFRTLFILGLIFPMTGEITQDIRSLITQQKRPTKALDRYLDNIMSVGGFGLMTDLYLSAKWGRLSETLMGPAIGTAAQTTEAIVKSLEAGKITPGRARQMLSMIGPLATYPHKIFYPSPYEKKKGEKSTVQSLIDLAEGVKWKLKKGEITPQAPQGELFKDVLLKNQR